MKYYLVFTSDKRMIGSMKVVDTDTKSHNDIETMRKFGCIVEQVSLEEYKNRDKIANKSWE